MTAEGVDDAGERAELELLNDELTSVYARMENVRKQAASLRKRADSLDRLANEHYQRARVIRNERNNLQLRIRLRELETEMREVQERIRGTEGSDE